jgi:hypothetical protein
MDNVFEALKHAEFATEHGLEVNKFGHTNQNGKSLTYEEKVAIGLEIVDARVEAQLAGRQNINVSAVAKKCRFERSTIHKIAKELDDNRRIISPGKINRNNALSLSLSLMCSFFYSSITTTHPQLARTMPCSLSHNRDASASDHHLSIR